ncbi:MAG: ribosomal protein S18-alanine N-acetyltransferase [Propionibacteriaceae bacterium]|nr:ribosomal protein S18-alanine N-acetyltransferase [Propionibacteriaceae bacterium]
MSGLREVEPDDLASIMELEQYAPLPTWSKSSWMEETTKHHVVVSDTQPIVGVIALGLVSGTAEVRRVVVLPQNRRQGLGRSLMEYAYRWAENSGATEIFLEVSASNTAALGLYRKIGFQDVSVRRDYYGPGDDGVVMCLPIDDTQEDS